MKSATIHSSYSIVASHENRTPANDNIRRRLKIYEKENNYQERPAGRMWPITHIFAARELVIE